MVHFKAQLFHLLMALMMKTLKHKQRTAGPLKLHFIIHLLVTRLTEWPFSITCISGVSCCREEHAIFTL